MRNIFLATALETLACKKDEHHPASAAKLNKMIMSLSEK